MPSATSDPNSSITVDLYAVQVTTASNLSVGNISDAVNITKDEIDIKHLISENATGKSDINRSSNAGTNEQTSPPSPTQATKPDNSVKSGKSKQLATKSQTTDSNNIINPSSSQANSRTSKLTRSPSGRSKETTVERRNSKRERKKATTAKNSESNKAEKSPTLRAKAVKWPAPDSTVDSVASKPSNSDKSPELSTTSDITSPTPETKSDTSTNASQDKRGSSRRKADTPPHLNLAFKNDQQSSKESASRSAVLSPKIRELRKSETFQNKPSKDEPSSDRQKTKSKFTSSATTGLASKRRHWTMARHAIKTTAAVRTRSNQESVDKELLKRLEDENSKLPPQVTKYFFSFFFLVNFLRNTMKFTRLMLIT
jgi:hypothetical protein